MAGELMSAVIRSRGYREDFLKSIETVSQHKLKDIDKLCGILHGIKQRKEHITVLPDFDMDGISSGVLGFAGLSELGFSVSLYTPDSSEGYGFEERDIDRILGQYPSTKVILTCDVGSSCQGAIAYAVSKGIRVLVTDHHVVPSYPESAECLVNPMQKDDEYEHTGICGAYVLWQVLSEYSKTYGTVSQEEDIDRLRVFAGIGTISDSMPMLYENRQLVRDSIAICRSVYNEGDFSYIRSMHTGTTYTLAFQGLFYVLKAYHELGKINCPDDIDETFFGYYLAPLFNSIKRMGRSTKEAFLVFFGSDQESHVAALMALNESRKILVDEYMDKIMKQYNPYEPYIYVTDVPGGLAGLIAMKLHLLSGMPTIVVRREDGRFCGSGRSPSWLPFISMLDEYRKSELVESRSVSVSAAGHETAFGFFANTDDDLRRLYDYLERLVDELADKRLSEKSEPVYDAAIGVGSDIALDVDTISAYVRDKDMYRPFGRGFELPSILVRVDREFARFDYIGSEKQHLRIMLPGSIKILCWNQAGAEEDTGDVIEIIGDISRNIFNDKVSYQIVGDLCV